jgi:hypothetical protein
MRTLTPINSLSFLLISVTFLHHMKPVEKFLCFISLSTGCQIIGFITAASNAFIFLLLMYELTETYESVPYDDEYTVNVIGEED